MYLLNIVVVGIRSYGVLPVLNQMGGVLDFEINSILTVLLLIGDGNILVLERY